MARQQKVFIPIPNGYSTDKKQDILNKVVQYIRDNHFDGGQNANGDYPEYSEAYAKRKGVAVGDVDLQASGDMKEELTVLNLIRSGGYVGYLPGAINDKVEGNRIGSYGGAPDPSKARDFLLLDEDTVKEIISSVPLDEDELSEQEIEDQVDRIYRNLDDRQREALLDRANRNRFNV